MNDPIVMWQRKYYLSLLLFMNIGLPAFLGFVHGDILAGILLGGLLRLVLSQHVTYLINSIAHMWGRQPYSENSSARDNTLLAFFTYGEGYHNYHHTFQWDYRNGIRWWHFDPTKWIISLLALIGLTHDLKRCNTAQIEKARLELQYRKATEKCERFDISETWRLRLESEYEQFLHTLQLWTEHRQAWYEARGKQLQESFHSLDQLQLKHGYREMQFRLKTQKRRWQHLLHSLAEPHPQLT
jgi:stearoyl-CoA desaturase (delta-9 desaturase)